MKYLPKARIDNIVVQNIEDEVLIYELTTNQAFCLNATSALIWQLCDGKTSICEISRRLSAHLQSSINEDLIWLALAQLKKENLLAGAESLPDKFEGSNRREIIKRVGSACMAALPVISSLVAPPATSAASVCVNPNGQAPNTTVRTTPGGFAGCYEDCSAASVGARCCTGSARATAIVCDAGPPQRTSCLCN